jgi:predicted site-specific integrase-resolvase
MDESVLTMLTSRDVMNMLNVSMATLHRWRKSGKLPYVEFPKKTYRYSKADIDKILKGGL